MAKNGEDTSHTNPSEGDTTGESHNVAQLEQQQMVHHDDGTVEITDTLPKKEYYMSLRTNNNRTVDGTAPASRENKPSGKLVPAVVVMLDGTEEQFEIDKNALGQELLDAVCARLDLVEREFFGITYKDSASVWFWLTMDKKISKQLGSDWHFEFQVKFYPPQIDSLREDLTRYYLCLQVRQDIVSGQLPCSFPTYVLLGAYVVQSEAGDHNPQEHFGVEYIKTQPFAPTHLQTGEMLERIAELHRLNRGQTPEEADRNFLENAKKLAMYGVDQHKAKDSKNEDVSVGVYHDGLLIYRARLRIGRFSWPRIIKFSYKGPKFSMMVRPNEGEHVDREVVFRCKDNKMAKRLWKAAAEHHSFFRLRSAEPPKKPNLMPGFGTRKYRFSGPTLKQINEKPSDRTQPKFKRVPTQRKQVEPKDGYPDQTAPIVPSEILNNASQPKDQYNQDYTRPGFDIEHWRMSPADCQHGIGMDNAGLDVAAQHGAGWQGCRSNKGVKGPGQYYYEGTVIEDGLVRLGWSTNDANLDLGADNEGFGFGADMSGVGARGKGRKLHKADSEEYGLAAKKDDVIGCYIDLDTGMIQWSHNGEVFGPAYTVPEQLRSDAFFPASSLKDARVFFNFGDQAFQHYPRGPWVPVSQSADDNQVPNRRMGWRLNPYDSTGAMDVAPDGSACQSQLSRGWQGCRANKGVTGAGKYYFEATGEEGPPGLGRVGWSTEEGNLDLGTDPYGFAYGADREGFGLNGAQGKKLHKDEIENYGEAFGKDDVIGCFIDLDEGKIKWSKNGKELGDAYAIPPEILDSAAFFPTSTLKDSTMEFNFGDKPFKYYPGSAWTPVSFAAEGNTKQSRRKGPELSLHHTGRTTDRREDVVKSTADAMVKPKPRTKPVSPPPPVAAKPASPRESMEATSLTRTSITNGEYTPTFGGQYRFPPTSMYGQQRNSRGPQSEERFVKSVEKGEPEVETETYYDEQGNLVKRTVKRTKVVTKMTSSRVITERSENEFSVPEPSKTKMIKTVHVTQDVEDDDDRALTAAILQVTGVDPDTAVLNDTVGDVEIRTKSQSNDTEV